MARFDRISKTYFDGKMNTHKQMFPEYELSVNAQNYKNSLDRIIEKYSKLQNQDDAIEVDLNNIKPTTLAGFMNKAKKRLDQMEAQSVTDVSDESLRAHDCTGDPQLDFSHRDGDPGDSSVSASRISVEEDEEAIRIDTSQWSDSMMGFQPEDRDEELELSLRGNSSLLDLYPSMISRLEQACHRHYVFETADSVLRRYRKWRQQPHKSHLNRTFDVTLTHRRPRPKAGVSVFVGIRRPLQSPGRGRSPQRRAQQGPALVMDFSDSSHVCGPTNRSLDQTFNLPAQEEPSCSYSASPPRRRPSLPRLGGADVRSPFKTRMLSSPPGHHRLGRRLSFDASLPLGSGSYSSRDLDEDFIKLYHQIVCQSKSSFFSSLPCRYCARNPEASRSRSSSSSSLAALALSPHRSLLRKRAGEEFLYGSLGSKRSRVESHTSSPGSKRHSAEVLRRRLSLAEPARQRDSVCCSPGRRSFLPSCSRWSPSEEKPEGAWGRYQPAAQLPGMGFSLERKMAAGRSLRW